MPGILKGMKKRKTRRFPKFLLVSVLLALAILAAGTGIYRITRSAPQSDTAGLANVFRPALYSDTHVTQNAIIADPRFKNSAPINGASLVAAVLGAPPSKSLAPAPTGPERGTWIWQGPLEITPADRDSLIASAQERGIKEIYLSLDSYLDIYALPDGPEKAAKKKAFDAALEAFIAKAHESGIAVDAEGGWRNWGQPGNTYKAFALLDYAIVFNATQPEKLRGFQYDVEPYLLDEYQTDKAAVLKNYLDLMYDTVTRLDGSDLAFSVVIPDFYDGAGDTPEFWYGLSYGFALDHLLAILERRPGSTLVVMAYHNQADGVGGSIQAALDEVRAADRSKTRVVLAQETSRVQPSDVTFYRMSRSYLDSQLAEINKTFANDPSFGGVAFHYLSAFLALQ